MRFVHGCRTHQTRLLAGTPIGELTALPRLHRWWRMTSCPFQEPYCSFSLLGFKLRSSRLSSIVVSTAQLITDSSNTGYNDVRIVFQNFSKIAIHGSVAVINQSLQLQHIRSGVDVIRMNDRDRTKSNQSNEIKYLQIITKVRETEDIII